MDIYLLQWSPCLMSHPVYLIIFILYFPRNLTREFCIKLIKSLIPLSEIFILYYIEFSTPLLVRHRTWNSLLEVFLLLD